MSRSHVPPARRTPPAPSRRWLAGILLLATVLGCSESTPTEPTSTESLGAPVTGPGILEPGALLWSASSDELLGATSIRGNGDGRLLAIHPLSGLTRTLDLAPSIPAGLSPDGSTACYTTTGSGPDSVFARVIGLAPGYLPRTLAATTSPSVHAMAVAPDGDAVAVGTLGDSLAIHRLSTGVRAAQAVGAPIAFSPASDRLLFNEFSEPLAHAQVLTLAGGAIQPAGLGVPDTVPAYRVQWTTASPRILYVSADLRHVYLRDVGTASTTLILTAPDTLDTRSLAWSADGARTAIWSYRTDGGAIRFALHGVEVATHAERILAFGSVSSTTSLRVTTSVRMDPLVDIFAPTAGAVAFSPDGDAVAYSFKGRVYRGVW